MKYVPLFFVRITKNTKYSLGFYQFRRYNVTFPWYRYFYPLNFQISKNPVLLVLQKFTFSGIVLRPILRIFYYNFYFIFLKCITKYIINVQFHRVIKNKCLPYNYFAQYIEVLKIICIITYKMQIYVSVSTKQQFVFVYECFSSSS